jgi:hypothetical protein
VDSLLYIPLGKPRPKFQQMNLFPTKSKEQSNNHFVTNLTPTSKRYPTQEYTSEINEKNTLGNQPDDRIFEEVTESNAQNTMQYTIKKTSEENGWFSKTGISNKIKNKNFFFL